MAVALALALMVALLGAMPVVAAEGSPAPSPWPAGAVLPGSTPACIEAFSAAGSEGAPTPSDTSATGTAEFASDRLDGAIRACASLEDWVLTALEHPEALPGGDPLRPLTMRCADPMADLDATASCLALAEFAAQPGSMPETVATAAPAASPNAVQPPPPSPDAAPDPIAGEEEAGVRVPRKLSAKVRGATKIRYFPIRGQTPDELMEAATEASERFCDHPGAIACVVQKWKVRTSETIRLSTGACTITGLTSTLTSTVFVPRWVSKQRVDPAMLDWWKRVLRKISRHEATHITIQKDGLAAFRRRTIGKPCSVFRPAVRRTNKQVGRAHARFDASEREKPWPERP